MSVKEFINNVSTENLKKNLFFLSRDIPFRTVLYHRPWHERSSLQEVDDFIADYARQCGAQVNPIPIKVRPFRCNPSKPLHHWYDAPLENDPWYDTANVEVTIPGTEKPEEIVQLASHKDSPSWINSPGAYDNAVGTVCNLEIIRLLAAAPRKRTVRILFCNEEHTPWHSLTYATACAERKDKIIAVLNNDSVSGGLTEEERAMGIKRYCAQWATPEGKKLADFMVSRAAVYGLPVEAVTREKAVNDDDGMFITAGFPCTVMNIGSDQYRDKEYHQEGDIPERVDLENLTLSVKLILGAVCELADNGLQILVQ